MLADREARPGPAGNGTVSLAAGALAFRLDGGAVRDVRFHGVEVVRLVDAPIRDADWRTLAVEGTGTATAEGPGTVTADRSFRSLDGSFAGRLSISAESLPAGSTKGEGAGRARLTLDLTLDPLRDTTVNRAGFILLHPIRGVAGEAVTVHHADGSREQSRFPARISPGQPVRDIAGLEQVIDGIRVAIRFEGDVFEMEDQRNWTDASFKTYCRPLSRPRPFALAAGDIQRQRIVIDLSAEALPLATRPPAAAASPARATLPEILLAHEAALGGTPPAALTEIGASGLILRVDAAAMAFDYPLALPVTLEIVADTAGDIARVAAAAASAGIAPRRVIALPRPYLASHQPEGPWPEPRPADFLAAVRSAFPDAEIGGGALTNFTEFNRCPPDPEAIDFATFGTTAIVHAGDDTSVIETLEALADVFASAAALVPGRPLHLGLVSIGMRSNPYGAAVAPNPDGRRIAMAMADPRQREDFAAAWGIAAAAAAARGGIASYAPAMTAGPLGVGTDGDPWPILEVVGGLAALAGTSVEVSGPDSPGGRPGLVRIAGRGRLGPLTLAANLGSTPQTLAGRSIAPMGFIVLAETT